jgi:NAD(P)-dependent dehydrogenase (short-subunit alcohol dehydrogenase family)
VVRLESKVAIVTGGGQGVGRGVALALAREGARVAVVGRTVSKCDRVAHEITERGGHALAFACDVTNRADVERCVGHVHESWGPVEVLVNAAQSLAYASLRRTTEDDMEMLWQSGPMGTFRFMQICFEDLRTTKGLIVNFGSGSGITAPAAMGGYAAVKEAIRTLSRTAAVEWGRHGIRVNVICPLAESPGLEGWKDDLPGAFEARVLDDVPLGRIGDPERDIGGAVVFLATADGAYITGTTIMTDGGYTYLR